MNYGSDVLGANIDLPEALRASTALLLGTITFLSFLLVTGLSYLQFPKIARLFSTSLSSTEVQGIYQIVVSPYQGWLNWIVVVTITDIILLNVPLPIWLRLFEFLISFLIALNVSFLGFKLITKVFDSYLLGVALENKDKINSELLVLAKFICDALVVLIVIFIFAQTHQINVLGLIASLGVGGVAIAFASQKVLEQILWSIVLYIDRPFTVDDYIHLPDSTLGRVESIGWRSTKIRLSGKNTLVIVPNSQIAQSSIENLTRARRVISIVNLTFFRSMSEEEKALIEQLILDSTKDILGIDHRLTQIRFEDLTDASKQDYVQTQLIFYILGAAESSMELRQNLLEIARENIIERLQDYGLDFNFEEKTLEIAQPMNI
ncbi:mechanosensitive ion channel family protein [Lusitaniella coriacea]|uniref:mechanosensitive ion channel family protein n=1 Tax=Lusitaniella coriacea TaxID=1983105 RepID=UPI003CF5551C